MNKIRLVAIIVLLSALAFISIGFLTGQIEVVLLVFIPVLIGEGSWAFLGMLLLFTSFILFFISIPTAASPRLDSGYTETGERSTPADQKSKFGGVIFIGPIPIIFGSGKEIMNSRWFLIAIVAIATIMLIMTLAIFLL